MSVFGPLVDGAEVQTAMLATLQEWLETYLRQLERDRGLEPGAIANPQSWGIASGDIETWFGQKLPAVLVRSNGVPNTRRESETYAGEWLLDVIVTVATSVRDRSAALTLAQRYGAAVRAVLVHKGSLGGFAAGTDWTGEVTSDDQARGNSRAVAIEEFIVRVDDVLSRAGGPAEPAPAPSPDTPEWPTVETTGLQIERQEPEP